MGCPKNPQKKFFGLFSSEGPHDLELRKLEHAAFYVFHYECRRCGSEVQSRPLFDVDLVRRGYDPRKIREHRKDGALCFTLDAAELEKCKETRE